jgi:mesencephalic astrocyte-derived neurotrophic factor
MNSALSKLFSVTICLSVLISISNTLKEGDCEVCIATVEKFVLSLDENAKKDSKIIETEFKKFCKASKGKENRFVSLHDNNVL